MLTSKNFYIVNDTDSPSELMVTVKTKKGFCYLDRDKKRYDGMKMKRPTSLDVFGFEVSIDECVNGFLIEFIKQQDTKATYKDGKPRLWKGKAFFTYIIDKDFYYEILEAE